LWNCPRWAIPINRVNTALEESPELVNNSPYGDGWFVEVNPGDLSEMENLMTHDACLEKLKGAE
jgi:glycine cleavage system H protein